MKNYIKIVLVCLIAFSSSHLDVNAEAKVSPRAYAASVKVKEYWENGVLIFTYEQTISSSNKGELALSATYDRRDSTGTGFIYYCYGRKHGYCNIQ